MGRLFGTDGIRGVFGEPPLDEATVTRLGAELPAAVSTPHPLFVLGGDTRDSTPALRAWLASGIESAGGAVLDVGTLPTPGVAFLVRHHGAGCGISVSASHNRHPDNGIKLIDGRGYKWSVAAESALEAQVVAVRTASGRPTAAVPRSGPAGAERDPVRPYLDALLEPFTADALSGLRICLDTANGAAAPFAGELFARLGADTTVLHAEPDGVNINADCGSTHPESLAREVKRGGCDLGAAFDGDADRVMLCDAEGTIRDGDALLYLWATDLLAARRLDPPAVVATTMSNLGLERSLERRGISLVRCDVGDRAVVETLRRRRLILGGEQSGHLVNLELATTGDGLQTALHTAAAVRSAQRSLAELLVDLERYPQILRNVPVREKREFSRLPALSATVERAEARLGDSGRLLLRYSGTEPVARIMLEGVDRATLEELADEIGEALTQHLGVTS